MYLNNHNTPIISPNNSTFTLLSIHKYKPNKASTSRYQLVNNVAFSLSIQCERAKQIYQCTKRGNKKRGERKQHAMYIHANSRNADSKRCRFRNNNTRQYGRTSIQISGCALRLIRISDFSVFSFRICHKLPSSWQCCQRRKQQCSCNILLAMLVEPTHTHTYIHSAV